MDCFQKWLCHFIIPQQYTCVQVFLSSCLHVLWSVILILALSMYIVVFHCGFNLHFPYDYYCYVPLCDYGIFIYLCGGSMCSNICPSLLECWHQSWVSLTKCVLKSLSNEYVNFFVFIWGLLLTFKRCLTTEK